MASSAASRKLKKEYATLEKEPVLGAVVSPLESNFLHAHFLLHGDVFVDTPFEGGVYHGVLKFPKNYPFAPPSVIMRTPSGRFELNKRICFSLSDFHPELWNPMWTTRSIITGLVSFMNSNEITTGGMDEPASHRIVFAKKSLQYCMEQDPLAMQIFSEFLTNLRNSRSGMGDSWPPPRPPPMSQPSTTEKKIDERQVHTQDTPKSAGTNTADEQTIPKATIEQERDTTERQEELKEQPSEPGKNAAKNKKKREKEKKKKMARQFITKLRKDVPPFVTGIALELSDKMGIDVSHKQADHVCWRTETFQEYSELVDALRTLPDDCTLLVESVVGGRPIATFRLMDPICANPNYTIDVIEIPSPKSGRPYKTGLEHVEFVICNHQSTMNDDKHRTVLDEFVRKHPDLDWDLKARDKEINPDVALPVKLTDFGTCCVKFHLTSLANVIEAEKQLSNC
jgi:ubiquitin-conjugating enzyme E2 J2